MGKHSRNKGARFEREVAEMFRALTGLEGIRRGRQDNKNRFVGNAHESDVAGVPGLWVEVKHVAAVFSPGAWWRQATNDADGTGREPVVVFKRDRGPVLVMIGEAWWLDARARIRDQERRDAFSLTRLPTARVSWDKQLPEAGVLTCLAVPLLPANVVIGRWEVFKELWEWRVS